MILLLVRSRLRADLWQLVGWVLGLAVTTLLVTIQVATTFVTGEARAATLHVLLATPVVLVFRGTPDGASAGAFMTALSLTFVAFLVGMMIVFLATRHSRAVEDSGLGDTLGSTTAARTGPVVSVLLLVVAWNAIAGVAVASGPALAEQHPGGSMLFGAACASTGAGTAGVVLYLAQYVSALVVAIVPRTSVGLAWSLYAAAAFVGEYGSIAGLPGWLRRLSPFEHVVDPFHVGPSVPGAVVMTAGALVVVGISALGMRFRDTDPDH